MSEQQRMDIDRLLCELDRAGDGWHFSIDGADQISHLRGLCRQAATGIQQLRRQPPGQDVQRYLGMILKEVGQRLTPDA